jgi:hypothetical protein
MLERAVEEIVKRFTREVFPDLELTFVEGQRRLADGNILDLHFRDAGGVHWVVELKRSHLTISTLDQLERYAQRLRVLETTTEVRGLAVGFSVDASVEAEAARRGLHVRVLKEAELRRIAERHGIVVDHASGYRPQMRGTKRSRSLVRKRSGARPATAPEVIAFVRALDASFPPGSLDASAHLSVLEEYWTMACPSAPLLHRRLAARLSNVVLTVVAGTAIATRSQSVSDPYTTIRVGDGRVAAAIDARRAYVKLDFHLPSNVADIAKSQGVLTVWNPRGYSVWVQSRVGTKIQADQAEELLRAGLEWEFHGRRFHVGDEGQR